MAWVLGIASIAAFFFLIDYTARSLRPVSIVQRIAKINKVIENVYPEISGTTEIAPTQGSVNANARTVDRLGRSAIVLAVNFKSLVGIARRAGGLVEFVPRVGDFVRLATLCFACTATQLGSMTASFAPRWPSDQNAPSSRTRRSRFA